MLHFFVQVLHVSYGDVTVSILGLDGYPGRLTKTEFNKDGLAHNYLRVRHAFKGKNLFAKPLIKFNQQAGIIDRLYLIQDLFLVDSDRLK